MRKWIWAPIIVVCGGGVWFVVTSRRPINGPGNGEPHLTFCDEPGCINVYFNKSALTQYALPNNVANQRVNLEQRLVRRLSGATQTIDLATYEINLPDVVQALIDRAADGVQVRVIADAKDSDDPHYIERYRLMRLNLERMVRGQDGSVGTADDIVVFSDSPIFAVEEQALRTDFGLPGDAGDLPHMTAQVGNATQSGRLLSRGEQKAPGRYYSPGDQMHNKFAVVDGVHTQQVDDEYITLLVKQFGCMEVEVHVQDLCEVAGNKQRSALKVIFHVATHLDENYLAKRRRFPMRKRSLQSRHLHFADFPHSQRKSRLGQNP